jgi:hypothetical protein
MRHNLVGLLSSITPRRIRKYSPAKILGSEDSPHNRLDWPFRGGIALREDVTKVGGEHFAIGDGV